jgi:CRISPR-associated protein Csb1
MSEFKVEQHDDWLRDDGPAALVFHRTLLPVEGKEAWIFPPTFAQSETAEDDEESNGGNYQIDDLSQDPPHNVCLIDSIGSQANRMEPVFKLQPYATLVPQRLVQMKDGDTVNLLDLGHRAADAAVRFSKELGPRLWSAFELIRKKRDCSALAKLAPTSLVFGVWDSRATGVKIPRIVRSVIRAYDVKKAKRSATYQAAYDYTGNGMIDREHDKGSGKTNPLSQEGFKYSIATGTHGGVRVSGVIRQEAIINLVALRTLAEDMDLKRYLLGLALVALSYRDQQCFNLREGCLLRAASHADYDGKWLSVRFDGMEEPAMISHDGALAYATLAAQNINVDNPEEVNFDQETADAWLKLEKKERKNLAKTLHPTAALEKRRAKQSEDDAKSPVEAALKALKSVKLGAKPKAGKPPILQTNKFHAVLTIFEGVIGNVAAEAPVRSLANELAQLIREDKDSHSLQSLLTKRLEVFRKEQSANTDEDESRVATGEGTTQ